MEQPDLEPRRGRQPELRPISEDGRSRAVLLLAGASIYRASQVAGEGPSGRRTNRLRPAQRTNRPAYSPAQPDIVTTPIWRAGACPKAQAITIGATRLPDLKIPILIPTSLFDASTDNRSHRDYSRFPRKGKAGDRPFNTAPEPVTTLYFLTLQTKFPASSTLPAPL